MGNRIKLSTLLLISIVLCTGLFFNSSGTVSASPEQIKEINLVFVHGLGSTSAATQLLADTIEERSQTYISTYEQANPGITIRINTLQRSYPNEVDIDIWAQNIADSIKQHFAGKKDIILIGHSMGGKAALYGVAHNTANLSALVNTVVTINSPVKALNSYYVFGGGSVSKYLEASRLVPNDSVAERLGSYDSSADGLAVANSKHWLAFISAESAPTSIQFDHSGIDPFPKDMDDGLVPISAQYAEGADVVYYGEHGHSDFTEIPEVAGTIADNILLYIFGPSIETSVLSNSQTFEHHAGWSPFIYYWKDTFGEFTGATGNISHFNSSFFKWQEWEDTTGGFSSGDFHSSFNYSLTSLPLITGIEEARWVNPNNLTDYRIYIKTRAAPRTRVRILWDILQYEPLKTLSKRDHYEIKVINGVSLSKITQASWLSGDPTDARLQIWSQAEGPFRWFNAQVTVYDQQTVQRKLIDQIPLQETYGNIN